MGCPRTTWTWGVGPSLRAAQKGWLRAKVRANSAWRLEALLGHLTQHRFGLFTSDPLSPTPCLCCCLFVRWESAVESLLPGRGQQGVCQPACLVVLLCAGVLRMYRTHWLLGQFCVCADIMRAVPWLLRRVKLEALAATALATHEQDRILCEACTA